MKKALLTIALSLGIYSQAQAITMAILHDTPQKLTVELDWHPGANGGVGIYQGLHSVQFDLTPYQSGEFGELDEVHVDLLAFGPVFGPDDLALGWMHGVGILRFRYPFFGTGEPEFVDVVQMSGKLAPDQMSTRWTFFAKDYLPAVPVPEGGATWLLLSLALLPLAAPVWRGCG
jgi:hypothetical protein